VCGTSGGQGEIHYETELVLHVSQAYRKGLGVAELVNAVALGLDFTLRDVQRELKQKGYPWLKAKGFLGSAAVTRFCPFSRLNELEQNEFSLAKNGKEVQRGSVREMIFSLQQIVDFCGSHFGLGSGDIIFTGTPAGVGPVADGDVLQLSWGENVVGVCRMQVSG